eukprot:CAMPEP_0113547392 /NCGR_PEP_ID=MMETSP0015_2-20120614/12329_1 /TAXON_ID=2838 /ORGANISM="Odontella" /LENGTH=505 /DNA_ID=CAMNT_0000447939 /DNA_START=413 /DNA_END=1933 /DNA_ORIENTATION=- /assembly_acc=CAM_ASM_000160
MSSTRRKATKSSSHQVEDASDGRQSSPSRKKVRRGVTGKRKTAVKPKKKQSGTPDRGDNGVHSGSDSDMSTCTGVVESKEVVSKKSATRSGGNSVVSKRQDDSSQSDSEAKQLGKEKAGKRNKRRTKEASSEDDAVKGKGSAKTSSSKKTKKADHQRQTERDDIPKLWDAKNAFEKHGSHTFKVMSWNVAGLRAVMKNHPTALPDLAKKYALDVIFLQETKLQECHVDDPKLKINGHLLNEEGFDSYYSCATAKKGYSGSAVFVKRRNVGSKKGSTKKKQATLSSFLKNKKEKSTGESTDLREIDAINLVPESVSYGLGKAEHDVEGRSISLHFPLFTLTGLYVPNSGQKLDRLPYRTEQWDSDLLQFMKQKEKDRGLPVVWLGDLNVAHTGMDTWNEGAKHLSKSAGTTPEERASFERQLEAGFVDAFRELHPDAKGHYTYWSQRAGNRAPNKGLRLDYFICSNVLMGKGKHENQKVIVRDSYMVPDQNGSDHCPIVLELEIKK